MGKLNVSKKGKKIPKVGKVDVTKASLTHAMKKLKYFKEFFFFLISFLVCHGKLVPIHNLVKFTCLEFGGMRKIRVQNFPN